jgi:O-antigen/teichoic acid export membrane protein
MSAVVRNSLTLMLSTVATALLSMLFWAVAAWIFAPGQVGAAAAGTSAMLLLGGLGQLALANVFARLLPVMGQSLPRLLTGCYALMTCATVVLVAGFAAANLGRDFLTYQPLPIVSFTIAVAAVAMSTVQDSALVALSRASWVPVKNSLLAVARLALLPVLAATGGSEAILIAWGAPAVVAVVVVNVALYGWIVPRRRAFADRPIPRGELLRLIGGQYANGVLNAFTLFFPPLLVTLVLGVEANAAFFLPWTLATGVIGLLWNITVPFVVQATANPSRTHAHARQALRLGLLLALGGAVALLIFAPWVLAIAGGGYSTEGTAALRLLAVALPFTGIASVFHALELMALRSGRNLGARMLAATIFLGSAAPAMHAFGATGAAAAFLASQVIVGLLVLGPVISRYRQLVDRAETALRTQLPLPVSGLAVQDSKS